MLLYCPKCQNLIDKVDEVKGEGDQIYRKCQKCSNNIAYYVKYKACSSLEKPDLTTG